MHLQSNVLNPMQGPIATQASRFCGLSYTQCEHYWSYIGKINIATRNLLNAAAKNIRVVSWLGPTFPQRIKNLTTQMKVLAIVSVFFTLNDLIAATQKIIRSIHLKDNEGIALGILSATIISMDAFDSLTTFVNATLTLASLQPIQTFSTLALPTAYAMTGLGTLSRIIQIAKTYLLYNRITKVVLANERYRNTNALRSFLSEQIGTGAEKEKKKFSLLRSAPQESVQEFEKLAESLEGTNQGSFTEKHLEEIATGLHRVLRQLERKMTGDVLAIVANMILLVGLILMSLASAGSAPFLAVALSFILRIVSLIYQDLTKGIHALNVPRRL